MSEALLTPLTSGGSIVIVVGDNSAKLSRLYEPNASTADSGPYLA